MPDPSGDEGAGLSRTNRIGLVDHLHAVASSPTSATDDAPAAAAGSGGGGVLQLMLRLSR